MSKLLIIAEKPSVAKQIALALGKCEKKTECFENDSVVISYAFGHLAEMYSPELEALHFADLASLPVIPSRFSLRPKKEGAKQVAALKKLIQRNDVSAVVNACDAGREGELIFRLLYELTGARKPVKRMWIKSMTDDGLRESFRNMRDGHHYDRLDQAARGRAEADYSLGLNATRAVSALRRAETGMQGVSSCGRVQTPVLTLVVEREQEIRNFVPKDYWEIIGRFGIESGEYLSKWQRTSTEQGADGEEKNRFYSLEQAKSILSRCQSLPPTKVEETTSPVREKAPKLFNQTDLQRAAYRRGKFSAQKTLDITQALYETHKLVTYPRTSSQALPEGDVATVTDTLKNAFAGSIYADFAHQVVSNAWVNGSDKNVFDDSRISDHFAIIPAPGAKCTTEALSADERLIYDLIVRRFIAVFYPAAEFSETKRYTHVAGELFYTSGKVMVSPGWKVLYPQTENSAQLCKLAPGENAQTLALDLKASKTSPPSRYTPDTLLGAMVTAGKLLDDAELSAAMKGCGLGTDATRAGIIEQLQRSKTSNGKPSEPYMTCEGKKQEFVPTQKAIDLIEFLKKMGITMLTSPSLTGEWEQKLALIEEGKIQKSEFMRGIGDQVLDAVNIIKKRTTEVTGKPLVTFTASNGESQSGKSFCACPNCKGEIMKMTLPFVKYQCNKCKFSLSGMIARREMLESEIMTLISTGALDAKHNYLSKKDKPFTASLTLDKKSGSISFNF